MIAWTAQQMCLSALHLALPVTCRPLALLKRQLPGGPLLLETIPTEPGRSWKAILSCMSAGCAPLRAHRAVHGGLPFIKNCIFCPCAPKHYARMCTHDARKLTL